MSSLRILLAEDHAAVRRALRSLVESNPRWRVCAEARNARETIEQARTWQPEVVLLDLALPDANVFETTREVHRVAPNARVFVMTTQEPDALLPDARSAGVESVLMKSDGPAILEAIGNGGEPERAIHLAGTVVGRTRHIGALFANEDERYEIMLPFIAEGVARGDHGLHIVDSDAVASHTDRLAGAGIDAAELEIVTCEDMYLLGGSFDQHAQRQRLLSAMSDPKEPASPITRLVANMEWALKDYAGVGDLVEYESTLNYDLPAYHDVVVCTYDLSRFDANLMVDVMRAHPAVILGGELHQNVFYVEPDKLLRQLRDRR